MSNIEARKIVIVKSVLISQSSFESYIDVPFQPNEVILRQLSLYTAGASDLIMTLRSDLISDTDLITFPDSICHLVVQTPFIIYNREIRGTYRFLIMNTDNELEEMTGEIALTFEFIKYKKS